MEALHKAEDEIYQDALSLLKRTARAAIMTLVRNMDPKVSPYVQVSAASKLLEQAMNVATNQLIEQRLQELEAIAAQVPHE